MSAVSTSPTRTRITVLERFVQNGDDGTYDFDGHLEADIEVRPRFRTVNGRRTLEGEYLAIKVADQLLSIPVACLREALRMPAGAGTPVEVSAHATPH